MSMSYRPKGAERVKGWLFDVYPAKGAMVVWVISDDGRRLRLLDPFKPPFYVQAKPQELGPFLRDINKSGLATLQGWTKKKDFWTGELVEVLQVTIDDMERFSSYLKWLPRRYPKAHFYNCDLHPGQHYFYERNIFPLAYCDMEWDERGVLKSITPLDSPWDLEYKIPPLRVMELTGSGRGFRLFFLQVRMDGYGLSFEQASPQEAIQGLNRLIRENDPDVVLTSGGDSFLFPALLSLARNCEILIELDRDRVEHKIAREGRSLFSYGRVLYMAPEYPLFGRWHIDKGNSFIYEECGFDGLVELGRLSKIPIQRLARRSTGTAITSMQLDKAVQEGILIPWKKAVPEKWKSGLELLIADKGGLVYQPILGLHEKVAELDFASMYPAIMAKFNVSPETVNCKCCPDAFVPEIGYTICRSREGLVPRVLRPILEKRKKYKELMGQAKGEAREVLDQRQTALKWCLVVSFGFLGYRNARFGRIEAHEAVTAYGREKLLLAKEICEEKGYRIIHAIVDALWVKKEGVREADILELCREISRRTGLSIGLEGVYDWIVFVPSRATPEVPVANRYFGSFPGGRLKFRGIEARRGDTPPLVRKAQLAMMHELSKAKNALEFKEKVPNALDVLSSYVLYLLEGRARPEELLITRTLSKAPGEYERNDPMAIAARQYAKHGFRVHPGESVSYVLLDIKDPSLDERVRILPLLDGNTSYDQEKYLEYLSKAAETLLSQLGYSLPHLKNSLFPSPSSHSNGERIRIKGRV